MSFTVRCQNLIGSYASTHSTLTLIGPCNTHPNIQSHKDTYAHTTDILAIFFKIAQELFGRRGVGGLYVSYSTAGLHPGSWINRLYESRKVYMWLTIYVEKASFFHGINLTMCGNIMTGLGKCCDCRESVDRQISGMCGWAPVTRILCDKHKNASWLCLD